MSVIQRTAQAEEDLIELWIYIAQDSLVAADRVLNDIEERFEVLADNPLMERLRPDIAPELRYFTVCKYLILYRAMSDGVQIVRVIHCARDLPHLFLFVIFLKAMFALIVDLNFLISPSLIKYKGGRGMNTKAYREWFHEMERLTRSQRKSVLSQLNAVESREAIIDELEKNHAHQCPHCQSGRLGSTIWIATVSL